jgi:hypothetical protein
VGQDFTQLQNQYSENALKREILFGHIFQDEEALLELKKKIETYKYPDLEDSLEIFKDSKK